MTRVTTSRYYSTYELSDGQLVLMEFFRSTDGECESELHFYLNGELTLRDELPAEVTATILAELESSAEYDPTYTPAQPDHES